MLYEGLKFHWQGIVHDFNPERITKFQSVTHLRACLAKHMWPLQLRSIFRFIHKDKWHDYSLFGVGE